MISIFKSSVMLLLVINLVMESVAIRPTYQFSTRRTPSPKNPVDLFDICDSDKNGIVSSADVLRVGNFFEFDTTKTADLAKRVGSPGVNRATFDDFRKSVGGIPSQVDLASHQDEYKTYGYSYIRVAQLLGITEDQAFVITEQNNHIYPRELAAALEATSHPYTNTAL